MPCASPGLHQAITALCDQLNAPKCIYCIRDLAWQWVQVIMEHGSQNVSILARQLFIQTLLIELRVPAALAPSLLLAPAAPCMPPAPCAVHPSHPASHPAAHVQHAPLHPVPMPPHGQHAPASEVDNGCVYTDRYVHLYVHLWPCVFHSVMVYLCIYNLPCIWARMVAKPLLACNA